MYRDFLKKNYRKYRMVLLTLSRNVIFQRDPFYNSFSHDICFSAEDQIFSEKENANSKWVQEIYGHSVLERMTDKVVSCSSITRGGTPAIRDYTELMCEEILTHSFDPSFPYDQPIHNYIVWEIGLGFGAVDLDHKVVSTVGCTRSDRIVILDDVVYVDGLCSPVVHQWERHQFLADYVYTSPKFKLEPIVNLRGD
jgi:hypothetical protein